MNHVLTSGCRTTQIDNPTQETVTDVRHVLLSFLLGFLAFPHPGIDQVSMETQYVEEGAAQKLFRRPTKTLPKSSTRDFLSRNTLGNRRRETAKRSKMQPRLSGGPEQRRRPTLDGVKQQQQENIGVDKKTRTSETRSVPNIRRAPTKAANRRRTKLRARNENAFSSQVRNHI